MNRITRVLIALALLGAALAAASPAWAQAQTTRRPSGIHYLYLIRHGAYDPDSTVTDETLGLGLNALGHEQAKLTGQRLAGLHIKLRSLVTSNYLRASQTAEDIGAVVGIKPVVDTLLHECTPRFESRPDMPPIGTETEALACEANLNAAFARYFVATPDADTYDVLVCHGNVTRWLTCKAMGIDVGHWRRMTIGNGSLTVLTVAPDGTVRLAAYSDTGHIPVEKQTWTGRGAGWNPPPAPKLMK
jgi:serine/threonine-protein phosphatase PGAM5